MISSIEIKNFKGIQQVSLNGLSRVTLISGKNNIGKSTLLESIFFTFDHYDPNVFSKQEYFRGINMMMGNSGYQNLERFFYKLNPENSIDISVSTEAGKQRLIIEKDVDYVPVSDASVPQDVMNRMIMETRKNYTLKFSYSDEDYSENGHYIVGGGALLRQSTTSRPNNEVMDYPVISFLTSSVLRTAASTAENLSRIDLKNQKDKLITALHIIDPTIEDVRTLSVGGVMQIYVQNKDGLIPLEFAGDGIVKLMNLVMSFILFEHSIILVDEIETGLHYSVYKQMWDLIKYLCEEFDCQLIATTHSYECISKTIDVFSENEDFSYFRIGISKDGLKAHHYDASTLKTAIDADMEVR